MNLLGLDRITMKERNPKTTGKEPKINISTKSEELMFTKSQKRILKFWR